jgi:transposase
MSDEYRRIEVITGMARRRRWSIEEKLRIIGESCEPGESVPRSPAAMASRPTCCIVGAA